MFLVLLVAAAVAAVPTGPVPVTADLLKDLPVVEARFEANGTKHTCKGPSLQDVLARLGAPQGEALRGKALSKSLIAHARDGYEVLFSLGELDASLGGETAIVATHCDGAALDPKDGPFRLVLPDDKRPARSVRQLQSLEIH